MTEKTHTQSKDKLRMIGQKDAYTEQRLRHTLHNRTEKIHTQGKDKLCLMVQKRYIQRTKTNSVGVTNMQQKTHFTNCSNRMHLIYAKMSRSV